MVVMCWCVMPEVLYVQSLPSRGRDLGALLAGSGSLARILFT